jgi:oligopeptide transport system substrate-binding protein
MNSSRSSDRGRAWVRRVGVIVWLLLIAAGCQDRGPKPIPGTLRFNLANEPPSLDWSIATDQSSIWVLNNLMEGLTRFDPDLKPIPALATSWDVLDDGKRYVFHLRPDARWTDGQKVTAGDFVYSWRRLVDPATAGEYAYFIYMVKNAEDINLGRNKDLTSLGVRALDDETLEVELARPVVFFPMVTAFICTFPMRADVVEKWGDNWTEPGKIVTCGPYRLTEWRHEYRMTLARNDGYYGPRPGLDRVVFYMVNEESTSLSLYLTGGLDVVDPMPAPAIPTYEKSPEYVNYPYLSMYFYGFNVTRPPVDNPLVRAALAHGIDRRQFPNILKGHQIPWATVLPYGLAFANPDLGREFDPARAKALLAEAGYPDPASLPTIVISYNTLEMHKMIAEFVQQQWQENLGIKVELNNMEWKVFLKELQTDPPMVWRLGWNLDYPDPDSIAGIFTSDSGNNHTRWRSPEYDALALAAAEEPDPAARQAMYDRLQRMIVQDNTIIVPLYSYTRNQLIHPWVKNFPANGLDLLYFHDTRIEAAP